MQQASQALLPHLCHLIAALGKLASSAAILTGVVLRICLISPTDWVPAATRHLHVVQALAQAYHKRSIAVSRQQQQQQQQQQQLQPIQHQGEQPSLSSVLAPRQQQNQQPASSDVVASSADVEGSMEGALLMLTLQFAQTTAGGNLLLDQGVSDLLTQLAQWLLSPTGGGMDIHVACSLGINQQA